MCVVQLEQPQQFDARPPVDGRTLNFLSLPFGGAFFACSVGVALLNSKKLCLSLDDDDDDDDDDDEPTGALTSCSACVRA